MDLQLQGKHVLVTGSSSGIGEGIAHALRQMAKQFGWGEDWNEIEQHILQQFFPNTVGRLGRVEDIAHLVAFLASPLSGYITGVNYRIDGGYMGTL